MASKKQIEIWKGQIEKYKQIYDDLYPGVRPGEKLIESFCKIHGIPYPLSDVDEEPEDEFDFLN